MRAKTVNICCGIDQSDVHSEKENGEAGVESGGWSDSDEKGKEKSGRERGGRAMDRDRAEN